MNDVQAVAVFERANQCGRRSASADEDPTNRAHVVHPWMLIQLVQHSQPDRRHARGEGHALAGDQFEKALASRCGPGNTCAAPKSVASERQTPRVHVKHRHDRENSVSFADAQSVNEPLAERVQDDRAVRVQHAFRSARGARRVTHGGRGLLVERWFHVSRRISGSEKIFVCDQLTSPAKSRTLLLPSLALAGFDVTVVR